MPQRGIPQWAECRNRRPGSRVRAYASVVARIWIWRYQAHYFGGTSVETRPSAATSLTPPPGDGDPDPPQWATGRGGLRTVTGGVAESDSRQGFGAQPAASRSRRSISPALVPTATALILLALFAILASRVSPVDRCLDFDLAAHRAIAAQAAPPFTIAMALGAQAVHLAVPVGGLLLLSVIARRRFRAAGLI